MITLLILSCIEASVGEFWCEKGTHKLLVPDSMIVEYIPATYTEFHRVSNGHAEGTRIDRKGCLIIVPERSYMAPAKVCK